MIYRQEPFQIGIKKTVKREYLYEESFNYFILSNLREFGIVNAFLMQSNLLQVNLISGRDSENVIRNFCGSLACE